MKSKDIDFYMNFAETAAMRSHCIKKKVGAVIVSADGSNIIAYGYNGSPKGMSNCCEDYNGKTLPTTIHAELNAIAKAATLGHSTKGTTLFTTLAPCVNCAVLILQTGISEVFYKHDYKDDTGINLLKSSGVVVRKFEKGM
jgi:dCMP deaminase